MTRYRNSLPQLTDKKFLTDGGMETTLVFHDGIDLPYFAAFDQLKTVPGTDRIRDYYRRYAAIATTNKVGFVLESVTWRASSDWGNLMGYSATALDAINKQAIEILQDLREELETDDSPMVISGCIGPRGDGYDPGDYMTAEEAQAYHAVQIKSLSDTAADMVTAMTITYAEEATGMVRAANAAGIPIVISFTLETDGRLPSGQSLKDAIEQVDEESGCGPAYYMINCAHPEHFADTLAGDESWLQRIHGIRANASNKSHAELDECEQLDDGNPHELGQAYRDFSKKLKQLNVFGGCCGTDHRHVEAICKATLTV